MIFLMLTGFLIVTITGAVTTFIILKIMENKENK
jgi:hypothetical protein